MPIYTKKGDRGFTILNNKKLKKSDAVFEALGDLDELNANLGLARFKMKDERFKNIIKNIQILFIDLMAEIANCQKETIDWNAETEKLETEIDKLMKNKNINHFIIPGENELSALLNISRAICRRAERSLTKLKGCKNIKKFVNRLSDYLFALSINI
ncbi:MAG: ATP/cobalamin adenosyltransferase [Candidatus Berkelbacteria bacterium Licking1014_85]|uniref:Corrinoid adenosyltransferase n=1 Tax=Candidatus Berkelbacteria bacterium Licking1014_85 TaxID=2017148 RepID=A0A554LHP9_9BACT|nr:MAG: ATP/cobalamin adenosyltransferase [Candidatus Berkelbacteria bacterium Licking1014_85]